MIILNGWAGPEMAEQAYAQLKDDFIDFKIIGDSPEKAGPPIWRLAKRINGGNHIRTLNQETGDCCSMGATNVLEYGSVADIIVRDKPITYKKVFPPFIYGVSRTADLCGAGRLGRSAGSTGAWTAAAVKNYGVLFEDDPNVPKYSGNLADKWGYSGVPEQFYKEASDNLVTSTARLTTVEQVRESLINYFMVTVASSWAFEVSEKSGVKIYKHNPRKSWGHQMCWIAWRDDPFPAAFRHNSWGDSTGPSLEGEPLGGAWQPADEIEQELRQEVEVYAYSGFNGFPAAKHGSIAFV